MYHTLRKLARSLFGTATTRKTQPMGSRFRPRLECLEERAVPAVLPAATFAQLKDAIIQANNTVTEDTIEIPANTTITLTGLLPTIKHNLVIKGADMTSIIQGQGDAANPTPEPSPGRLFTVIGETDRIAVDFSDLVLARGDARGASGKGGAIFADNVALEITNVRFEGNRSSLEGGAIFMERQNDMLTVKNSHFLSNYAEEKGGAITSWSKVFIENSTFTSNTSNNLGGAMYLYNHTLDVAHDISASNFISNRANRDGGAILLAGQADLTIDESSFQNNTAGRMPASMGGSGGAIYTKDAYLIVERTVFENNSSAEFGGAIFVNALSGVIVEQSIFHLNKSGNPFQLHSVYIASGGGYLDDDNTFYLDSMPYWE